MTWIEKLHSSPKVVMFVVAFALFMEEVLYGVVAPLTPDAPAGIKDEHMVSTLYGAYALGLIVSVPVLALVTDRIGRRLPMMVGAALLTISAILFCIGSSIPLYFIGRILEGIGASCTWTAGLALVAEYFVKKRVKAMGFAILASTVGSIIGPVVGGEMCEQFGYRIPFYVCIALLFVDLFFVSFFLAKGQRHEVKVPWSKHIEELKGIVSDHSILTAGMAVSLAAASWALMEPLFPMHILRIAGSSSSTVIGIQFTISNIIYAVLTPMVDNFTEKWGVRQVTMAGLLSAAVFLPLLAFAPNIPLSTVALCLITVSYAFTMNPASAELGDAVDRRGSKSYAIAYAVYNLAYSLGMIGVDAYVEYVTDETHKLELLHILLIMSVLYLVSIAFFKKGEKELAA